MKNLKKLTLAFALLLAGSNISAQKLPYSLSVNGGMNVSNMDVKYLDTKLKIGYKFNVLFEYNLSRELFLQTGLEFSNKGAKIEHSEEGDINGDGYYDYMAAEGKFNTTYLSVPLMAGYRLPLISQIRMNITLGPYLGYGVGGKTRINMAMLSNIPDHGYGSGYYEIGDRPTVQYITTKDDSFSKSFLRHFDMGIAAGVGVEYSRILLNIGYEYGFINQLHSSDNGDGSSYNTNFFVSLGYRIF